MTQSQVTLAALNELRKKVGQSPLKKWKDSHVKLVEAYALLQNRVMSISAAQAKIQKFPPAVADGAYPTDRAAQVATGHTPRGPSSEFVKKQKREARAAERAAAKAEKKASAKAERDEKKLAGNGISLVTIAKRIGMEGRHARQKMRRIYKGDVSKLPKRIEGGWVFSPKDADKIEKMLKQDHRKNGD